MTVTARSRPVRGTTLGDLLREWRGRRRLSQLALALEADISQRHLSFVESGRAQPSREMVLRLAAVLDLSLRDRNRLLAAAGYAPMFPERPLDHPALEPVHRAVERVLRGHEPYPALAIDARWTLRSANRAVGAFLTGVAPSLLEPPVNVIRLTLHPDGLAPRIVNMRQWHAHLLERVQRQAESSADPALDDLLAELRAYSVPAARRTAPEGAPMPDGGAVFVPMQLETDGGVLSLISTTMTFGAPLDVTLAEIAVESFFPADDESAERLRRIAEHAAG